MGATTSVRPADSNTTLTRDHPLGDIANFLKDLEKHFQEKGADEEIVVVTAAGTAEERSVQALQPWEGISDLLEALPRLVETLVESLAAKHNGGRVLLVIKNQ